MDRELFSRLVRESLLRDGCVGLPGLGSLQLRTFPASFSDRGFTLNPPFKKLVFVPEDGSDPDGYAAGKPDALSSLYAAANGIPEQRAAIAVQEAVGTIRKSVSPAQDFILPGVGRFRRLRDGALFFVQSQDVNLCPSFDNLPTVSLKSLEETGVGVQDVAFDVPAPAVTPDASVAETQVQPACVAAPCRKKSTAGKIALWTVCSVFFLLVLSAGLLAVLGRTRPQLVDPLLYEEEQLDVLYYRF